LSFNLETAAGLRSTATHDKGDRVAVQTLANLRLGATLSQ